MSEEQFLRLERMIGSDLVEKLHRSHVTVAGAGAVGGFAFESLVRSGVGKIRIIDFEFFNKVFNFLALSFFISRTTTFYNRQIFRFDKIFNFIFLTKNKWPNGI